METLPFNYLKPWFCHSFEKVPKPRTHGGKGEVSPNAFQMFLKRVTTTV